MKLWSKAVIHGATASLLLSLVYFNIVGYLESFSHAIGTFLSISYLMVPLIASFGVQIALYSYSRQYSRVAHRGSASVTACGGVSVGSMIACCAHHVTDIIPVIGITVASALTAVQPLLIAIGLSSNVIGILTILSMTQKHHLYDSGGALARIMHLNIKRARRYAIVLSSVMIAGLAWASISSVSSPFRLEAKTVEQRGLTINVTPTPFSLGQEVKFKVAFDTHAESLSFDVVQAASLKDDHGNTYTPKGWSGSPPGGHHREGVISFPPLSGRPHSIKLVMKGIYGVDSWVFDWSLT